MDHQHGTKREHQSGVKRSLSTTSCYARVNFGITNFNTIAKGTNGVGRISGSLPLPPRKQKQQKTKGSKENRRCSTCVSNSGIYSDFCPGRYTRTNCCFFAADGSRKPCSVCREETCDGGDDANLDLCRHQNGKGPIRMCEELLLHIGSGADQHDLPALPVPQRLHESLFPSGSMRSVLWQVDREEGMVVTANFRGVKENRSVSKSDLACLLKLFEIPYIAVISKGLAKGTKLSKNSESSRVEYEHVLETLTNAPEYIQNKDRKLGQTVLHFPKDGERTTSQKTWTLESFLNYHARGESEETLVSLLRYLLFDAFFHSLLTVVKVSC